MDSFEALSYGPEVASLLYSGGGHILAVTSNALYLESYEGYVAAIVWESAIDGPLSLRVHDLPLLQNALRQHRNVTFRSTGDAIDLDGIGQLSLRHASAWTPVLPNLLGEPVARYEAADVLAGAITE